MTDAHLPEHIRLAVESARNAPGDLMRDALVMSVNKNLLDVTTLLQWAHDERDADGKLRHVRHALAVMHDLEAQLADLADNEAAASRLRPR